MRDTIDMARAAELICSIDNPTTPWVEDHGLTPQLKAFEALVRADERNKVWSQKHWTEYEQAIVQAEREACAKVAERSESAEHCAAAIRARGETK